MVATGSSSPSCLISTCFVAVSLAVLRCCTRHAKGRSQDRNRLKGQSDDLRPERPVRLRAYAGRSQMAAALLDHEAHGRIKVTSAGSEPADQLNPAVIAAMAA